MKTIAPDREAVLQELHRKYIERSGREMEPFRFAKDAWNDLLSTPEYHGDAKALWRDMSFVIWYLKKQIPSGARRPGSLRTRCLLVPAQFLGDVAEAVERHAAAYKQHCRKFEEAPATVRKAACKANTEPEQHNAHVFVWQIEQARLQRQSATFGRL